MATYNDSTKSSTWSDPTAWTLGHSPIEGENARILNGHTIVVDQDITCGDDTSAPAIEIASGGTLSWPPTVVGDYTIKCKGHFTIRGTFRIGTSAAVPLPATRTATVKLNYSAAPSAGKYHMQMYGNVYLYGADTTNGATGVTRSLLNQDAAIGDNHIHTADVTGWKSGDTVVVAATDGTRTHWEVKTLSADSVGDTSTITGTFTYAHAGGVAVSYKVAEVIRINRNIIITSNNVSYQSCVYFMNTSNAQITARYASFQYMGGYNRGCIFIDNGAITITYCSFYVIGTSSNSGTVVNSGGLWSTGSTFSYNSIHGGAYCSAGIYPGSTMSYYGAHVITYNWLVSGASSSSYGIYTNAGSNYGASSLKGTWQHNRISGFFYGFYTHQNWMTSTATVADNIIHDCQYGYMTATTNGFWPPAWTHYRFTIYNCYRGVTVGGYGGKLEDFVVYSINSLAECCLAIGESAWWLFHGCTFSVQGAGSNADVIRAPTNGVSYGIVFEECIFDSLYTSTGIAIGPQAPAEWTFINCIMPSPLYLYNTSEGYELLVDIKLQNCTYQGSTRNGVFRGRPGWVYQDSSVFRTEAPSECLAGTITYPTYPNVKLESVPKFTSVLSGERATFSVWVRKSATYASDQPRLVLKADSSIGVTDDTVLDTAELPNGDTNWEQLSGQTPAATANGEFKVVVDSNGHVGTVNIDDWAVV